MDKELITEEQIVSFRDRCTELRAESKPYGPQDLVREAARKAGCLSCVQALAWDALLKAVNGEQVDNDEVCFWIKAIVGVSRANGGFAENWLEAFNRHFWAGLTNVSRELPSPYELNLPEDTADSFQQMLQAAVALAESRGKVDKKPCSKCVGFRSVKYWSESKGWRKTGFTADDRQMLKGLASCSGKESGVGKVSPEQFPARELADVRKELEETQQKDKEKQQKIDKLNEKLRVDETLRNSFQARVDAQDREIAELKKSLSASRDGCQQVIEDLKRQQATQDNRVQTRYDAVLGVVLPIYRQIEGSKDKPMSIELGNVLRVHIGRILEVLRENGFELK